MIPNIATGKKIVLLLLFILGWLPNGVASSGVLLHTMPPVDSVHVVSSKHNHLVRLAYKLKQTIPANKAVAVLLAVFTGPLGGHRIYLGTSPQVPLIYTLTIGGGFGALPLADIIAIIITPDLSEYINNPRVFMWIKEPNSAE